jgi:hypothetical protein
VDWGLHTDFLTITVCWGECWLALGEVSDCYGGIDFQAISNNPQPQSNRLLIRIFDLI